MTDQSVPYSAVMVVNNSGEEIPGRAVVVPDGTIDESGRIGVVQADADNLTHVLFNDASPIPDGEIGQAWSPYPWAIAGTDDADLPLDAGADMGTEAGEWYLRAGKLGFRSMVPPYYGQTVVCPAALGAPSEKWVRITVAASADPGPYTGVLGHLNSSGAWVDDSPAVTLSTIYRAPNEPAVGLIGVGQYVRVTPSPTKPGAWECSEVNGGEVWARITVAASANPGPYTGVRGSLNSSGVWVDNSPTVTYTTIYLAPNAPSSTDLIAVGQYVRLYKSPTKPGAWECYDKLAASGWFAAEIVSGSPGAPFAWQLLVYSGGLWVPTGSVSSANAWPFSIDGASPDVEIGSQVLMTLVEPGKYGFALNQYATYAVPGMVSTGTQEFRGTKTWYGSAFAFYPDVYPGPVTFTVSDVLTMVTDGFGSRSSTITGPLTVLGPVTSNSVGSGYAVLTPGNYPLNFYSRPVTKALVLDVTIGFAGYTAIEYDAVLNTLNLGSPSSATDVYVATAGGGSVRVGTGGKFWVGSKDGNTYTYTVTDDAGGTTDLEFTGGILTDATYTPGVPTILGDILADGGIDGGTF